MRQAKTFGLPALLLAAALVLTACSGSGSAEQGSSEQSSTGSEVSMQGMDHGSDGMASEVLMENGEYSDELFIDAMAPHHQGAVEMAQVAQRNAEHSELRQLADNIVAAQQDEIEELRSIKVEQVSDPEVPMEMAPEEMEMMGMTDAAELENQQPFDRAFIDAMIPHHESAIEMARIANEESDNPRVRDLAGRFIEAQESEIKQIITWREEWYPESR